MKTRLKQLAISIGLGFAALNAHAAVTDQLTVSITPNAYYSVVIDTTNVSLNLGTVALSASTQTVRPSTITIQSTYAQTDIKIQGSITSAGGTPWTFDSNTASVEADALAAWATFTSVARSSAPAQGADYFSGTVPGAVGSDVVDGSSRYVGSSVSSSTTDLFENASNFDAKDMDALLPNAQADLWLYFRLPSATTSNTAQDIVFTITAVQPN